MSAKNLRLLPLLLAVTFAGPFIAAHGASFDCGKARQGIETMICGSSQVSRLDEDLAAAYRAALAESGDVDAAKAAQREWLRTSRDACRTAVCLAQSYTQRIEALSKASPVSGTDAPGNAGAVAAKPPATRVRPQAVEAMQSGKAPSPAWEKVTPAERVAFEAAWDELLEADETRGHLRRVELARRLAGIAARVGPTSLHVAMLGQLAGEYRRSGQFDLSKASLGQALAAVESIKGDPKGVELVALLQKSGRDLDEQVETSLLGIASMPRRDEGLVERFGWGNLKAESEKLFDRGQYDTAALLFFEAERKIGEYSKVNHGRAPPDEWAAFLSVASMSNSQLRVAYGSSDSDRLKRARALIYLNTLRPNVDSAYEYHDIAKAVDFIVKQSPKELEAAIAQEYLGRMAIKAGLYLDVNEPLEQAIKLREWVMGPDDPAIAENLIVMADYEKRRHRRWHVIEPMYARAYRIQAHVLGEKSPVTRQTLENYDEATKQNRADQSHRRAVVRQLERAFEPEPAIEQLRGAFLSFDGACRARIGTQTAEALSQIRMLLGLNSPGQALAAKSLARSQLQIVRSVGCAPR